MKIFIIGLPRSGRTTVAKAIAEAHGYQYIDAMSWVRSAFREIHKGEHPHQYEDEYQQYLTKRMSINPWFVTDYVYEMMKVKEGSAASGDPDTVFVIDGIQSPRDFVTMFDYRQDVVVFLNRTDNEHEFRDHENIGASAIRDYCFWMSSASLINKQRWLEYNFRIPGEDNDHVKQMGAQNSVFIIKSIKKVISHLTEKIGEIVSAQ
jgi:adenylate kinase family enzyme